MHFTIEKIIDKYTGFFKVKELLLSHDLFEGGSTGTIKRELIQKGNAAAVLLYDPDLRQIAFTEQFRIGAIPEQADAPQADAWLTELVAGYIEPGESDVDVIHRESMEEAGCHIEKLHKICKYFISPGSTSETISLYCGKVDSRKLGGIFGLRDEGENIRIKIVSVYDAYQLMDTGEIKCATPYIALQWLQLNEKMLMKKWT